MAPWAHFHHMADIGVRGTGQTKEEAFEQAALALTGVITEPASVNGEVALNLKCSGEDDEILLVEWLNTLVYEMATRKMLFGSFDVEIEGDSLRAEVCGEPIDIERHQPAVEVKGATFTCVQMEQLPGETWVAQCVVDV